MTFATQRASMDGRAWPGEHDRGANSSSMLRALVLSTPLNVFCLNVLSSYVVRQLSRGEQESHATPAATMAVDGVLEGCTLPQMCRALCDRRKVNAHLKATPV